MRNARNCRGKSTILATGRGNQPTKCEQGPTIYRYAAGIDTLPDDPGFHTILLHPNFDRRLGSLDFSYESGYGTIHSAWTISGDLVAWNPTIPPNAKGELPVSADQIGSFKLIGQPLAQSRRIHSWRQADGNVWYELPAGTYDFTVTLR